MSKEHIKQALASGLERFKRGEHNHARRMFEQVLLVAPNNADACHFLALVFNADGDSERAVALLQKAATLTPKNAEIWSNLGTVELGRRNVAFAEQCYRMAIKVDPLFVAPQVNLARLARNSGRLDEAYTWLSSALAIHSTCDVAIELADILQRMGRLQDSSSAFDRALALDPNSARANNGKGTVLAAMLNFEESERFLARAVELDPGYVEAWTNLGAARVKLNSAAAARAAFERAIALQPDYLPAYVNFSTLLSETGAHHEALTLLDSCRTSFKDNPDWLCSYGVALRDLARFSEAMPYFDQALSKSPSLQEATWGRGLCALSLGDYEAGWRDYDKRTKKKIDSTRPRWVGDGDPGRLLICSEQGLGDEVFFASGLTYVKSLSSNTTVQIDRRLLTLFRRSFSTINFVGNDENVEESTYDQYMLAGNIFQALRGRVEDPERRTRGVYLTPDFERARQIRSELTTSGERLCGITWRSQRAEFGQRKSLTLEALRPLLDQRGVRFVSLQYGEVTEEIDAFCAQTGIEILQCRTVDNFNDIDGHAALIEACDDAILVCNTTAHLAGALGKKALVLALHGRGRLFYWNNRCGDHSFWYPSLRIVDQELDFTWDKAIQVAAEILRSEPL